MTLTATAVTPTTFLHRFRPVAERYTSWSALAAAFGTHVYIVRCWYLGAFMDLHEVNAAWKALAQFEQERNDRLHT